MVMSTELFTDIANVINISQIILIPCVIYIFIQRIRDSIEETRKKESELFPLMRRSKNIVKEIEECREMLYSIDLDIDTLKLSRNAAIEEITSSGYPTDLSVFDSLIQEAIDRKDITEVEALKDSKNTAIEKHANDYYYINSFEVFMKDYIESRNRIEEKLRKLISDHGEVQYDIKLHLRDLCIF